MLEFRYENVGSHTFLVYDVAETDMLDSMSLGMITNNKIRGFADALFFQMDSQKAIKYNISSKVSLSAFLSGTIKKAQLLGVLKSISEAYITADDYMIDSDSIITDPNCIFVDVSSKKAVVICVPLMEMPSEYHNLFGMLKSIITGIQYDQNEDCGYVAKLFNYFNGNNSFSVYDFDSFLNGIIDTGKTADNTPAADSNKAEKKNTVVSQNVNNVSGVPGSMSAQSQSYGVNNTNNNYAYNNRGQNQVRSQVQNQGQNQVRSQGQNQGQNQVRSQAQNQGQNQARNQAQSRGQNQAYVNSVNQTASANNQRSVSQNAQANGGFAVPNGGVPKKQKNQQPVPQTGAEAEQQMGLFYLLQHYNKENAAAYKAQKAEKKRKKNQKGNDFQQAEVQNNFNNQAVRQVPGSNMKIPGKINSGVTVVNHNIQNSVQTQNNQNNSYNNVSNSNMNTNTSANSGNSFVNQNAASASASQSSAVSFGETTVLGVGMAGETTVLSSNGMQQNISPQLYRMRNNERIPVNKPIFKIGKERSYVDYFISDNSAISRSHANVLTKNGKYYVVDTNSTNHTYINGKMIQSNTEVEIEHGDKIRFANEDFEFRLY